MKKLANSYVAILVVAILLCSLAGTQTIPPTQNSLIPIYKPPAFSFTANGTKTLFIGGQVGTVIMTSGTFTGMTFNVFGSNDNTHFISLPIVAGLIGGAAPGTAATQPVTAGNPAAWSTSVGGLTQLQIQNICTSCTGTVTFQITTQPVKQ